MTEYKGYHVNDIIHYTDECDPALGTITRINNKNIVIMWEWAENNSIGEDILEHDDFDDLEPHCQKITEQERLAFLLRNT